MPNSQMLKKGKNIMTPSDMCANLYEDSLLSGHFYDGRKNVFSIPEKFFFQMYVKCFFFTPWLDLQM